MLLATLAGAALPPASAHAQPHAEHHRVTPTRTQTGVAGAAPPGRAAIDQALAKQVTRLQGFQPDVYLTSFDYGKTTKLSRGRTLREYQIIAEDKDLEIAPGIF
jgi:hypothetical protein